jgi:hypothetical protein
VEPRKVRERIAATVAAAARAVFDGRAMPQPSHIYTSTLDRRRRRWRRRRGGAPVVFAVLGALVIGGAIVLAAVLV